MALEEYKKKRSFNKTPEPEGKKASTKDALKFVVQKHDASHLHYDFRLEMEGVLKSWAVPKGPSLDPEVKRLAMMVEDHPYDYRTFEGTIPKGNYGAGTVIVWDEGTYESAETDSIEKKDQEKNLLHQLHSGKIKFIMHGKKLKGEFALVKASNRGENSWLLMKLKDKFASTKDITKQDKSVQSDKTIEEVEKTSDKVWHSNRSSTDKNSSKRATAKEENGDEKRVGKRKTASAKKIKPIKKKLNEPIIPADKKSGDVTIDDRVLKLTHLDKIFWPDERITKRDLLNYYYQITPYMLPYMKDRPQSLNRFPDGINGKNFFQKDVADKVVDWITTYHYISESDGEEKDFFVCTDEASLFYLAMLGCIEMNPWHSRVQSPENPDWCVIDLDPDNNSLDEVIEVSLAVKDVLDTINVESYIKTSGSTGMHIYIPFGAKYTYEQSRLFAELVVNMVYEQTSSITSLERTPSKRKGKIYLDYLQNRTIQTIAAPYSLRPKPGATVSAPLQWSEVKKGLSISDFNIFNIFERLNKTGDIFYPVLGEGISLEEALEKMQSFV